MPSPTKDTTTNPSAFHPSISFIINLLTTTHSLDLGEGRPRRSRDRIPPAVSELASQQGRSKGTDGQRERVEACCERTFTALLLPPPGSPVLTHPQWTPPLATKRAKRGGASAAASAPQHGRICDSAIASISATFCTHARVAGAKRL